MVAAFEPAVEGSTGWSRVYVDLPGCGESPAGPANSDGVVEAVCAYVDASFGAEPFLLAGCSYGGYLAAAIARRRPQQAAGLLLVCPGIKILPDERVLPEGHPTAASDDWLMDVDPALHEHLNQALGERSRQVAGRVGRLLSSAGPRDEKYLERLRTTGY